MRPSRAAPAPGPRRRLMKRRAVDPGKLCDGEKASGGPKRPRCLSEEVVQKQVSDAMEKRGLWTGRLWLCDAASSSRPLETTGPAVGETGSDEDEMDMSEPAKQKRARALKRVLKYGGRTGDVERGPTALERLSVTPTVWEAYKEKVVEVVDWLASKDTKWNDDSEVDEEFARWMNAKFFEGEASNYGEYALAAFAAFFPEFGRGGRRALPRTLRALKGWRRLAPTMSRAPLPWPAVCGIAMELLRVKEWQMAAWVVLVFTAYLRPREAMLLHRGDMVPPVAGVSRHWALLVCPQEREERTKVGAYDDSIALDSPVTAWALPVWKILAEGPPDAKVWDFDYRELLTNFKMATWLLGLEATPYQLRHSGPSWDRARGLRPLDEVQKRGRWRAMKSVMRYEKHARVAAEMEKLAPDQVAYFRTCEAALAACFVGGQSLPPAPRIKEASTC